MQSIDGLMQKLEKETKKQPPLLLQEKVLFSGKDLEVPFYLCADARSEIVVAATGQKQWIKPHPFGTAIVLDITWHEELLTLAQSIVSYLEWRGLLMIEFIFVRNRSIGRLSS